MPTPISPLVDVTFMNKEVCENFQLSKLIVGEFAYYPDSTKQFVAKLVEKLYCSGALSPEAIAEMLVTVKEIKPSSK